MKIKVSGNRGNSVTGSQACEKGGLYWTHTGVLVLVPRRLIMTDARSECQVFNCHTGETRFMYGADALYPAVGVSITIESEGAR